MGSAFAPSDDEAAALARGDYRFDRWERRLAAVPAKKLLTPAWRPLIPHPVQRAFRRSRARFKIAAAGRRSGKTDNAVREAVLSCLNPTMLDHRAILAAPTRDQAKRLFWDLSVDLSPPWAILRVAVSELTIYYITGARLSIVGMDKPMRAEGNALDLAVLDEYADMKPEAWTRSIRPMLSTMGRPPGRAIFIGRPRGKNHFYELYRNFGINPKEPEWAYFHWPSTDLLPQDEIESAMRLDDLSFRQEYLAEFITFEGRAYYTFSREVHAAERLRYDPSRPLEIAFDFNREPGVACYLQDQHYQGANPKVAPEFTAIIGEVHIPQNSTTPAVCRKIIEDWGPGGKIAHHQGMVAVYGDSTGGAKGSAKVAGSDWDIIRAHLKPVWGGNFRERVPSANTLERVRVNAVNARFLGADGKVRMLVDPVAAPWCCVDFDDVTLLSGGAGEIDKDAQPTLTHHSDGAGYFVVARHPIGGGGLLSTPT